MIYDDLENLFQYNILPDEALDFVSKLNVNTPDGRYDINDKIYANIETYPNRKSFVDAPLESHKKYVDVQIVLFGEERIDYTSIDGLEVLEHYDHLKDITFYKRPTTEIGSLFLNGRNFAVFMPQDAHAPQITTLALQNNVKKVVIKIAVEYL